MKLSSHLICRLTFLSFLCLLKTAKESEGAHVPGRCLCPQTRAGIRGKLKELTVLPRSARCNTVTVIVTMMNNKKVCLNPEAPMGRQLIRCKNKAEKLGRDVKICLKRKRRAKGQGGRRQGQRQGQQNLNTQT